MVAAAIMAAARNDTEGTLRAARRVSDAISVWNRTHLELYSDAEELGRRGWTVPTWSSTVAVRSIVRDTTRETIDEFFVGEYDRQLRRLERKVLRNLLRSPLLERWIKLLRQCVTVYRRKKYLVVVPCLLAVFEGALASASESFSKGRDPKRIARERASGARPGLIQLGWISVESFASEIFRSQDFGAERPLHLNRHWVLHGRDKPSWSRADCLRLFQALDTVSVLHNPGPFQSSDQ
jgi:hypothetical protein